MKTAFRNLTAEMARKGLKVSDIAECVGQTTQNVYQKLRGNTPFTLADMTAIQKLINSGGGECSLDYLFHEN